MDNRGENDTNTGRMAPGIAAALSTMTKTQALILIIRVAILVFTILYLVPLGSYSTANLYQKALLSNAAISALRLHQLLPPFQFSREYLTRLLTEDSGHYLIYSLIFISNQPVTLVLLPIVLFAMLHVCSSLHRIINEAGIDGGGIKRMMQSMLNNQSVILLTIALTEVTLMPIVFLGVLTGLQHIFTPLFYYKFLTLRYASRRNPYSKQAFHWLRLAITNLCSSPQCPQFIRKILYKGIDFTCMLAPPAM